MVKHQLTKWCETFRYCGWLFGNPRVKIEELKSQNVGRCLTLYFIMCHRTNISNITISRYRFFFIMTEMFWLKFSQESVKSTYPINSLKVDISTACSQASEILRLPQESPQEDHLVIPRTNETSDLHVLTILAAMERNSREGFETFQSRIAFSIFIKTSRVNVMLQLQSLKRCYAPKSVSVKKSTFYWLSDIVGNVSIGFVIYC